MAPQELERGMVIDYRGFPATVVECWASPEEAMANPTEGSFTFTLPPVAGSEQASAWRKVNYECGAVIEWEDGNVKHRCRLLWGYLPVRDDNDNMTGEQTATLECDGLNGDLKLWGG